MPPSMFPAYFRPSAQAAGHRFNFTGGLFTRQQPPRWCVGDLKMYIHTFNQFNSKICAFRSLPHVNFGSHTHINY